MIVAGALVIGTFSVSIVLSQIYLRSSPALAAGLSIGLSIGIGGAFTVVIGGIGDAVGLELGARHRRGGRRRVGRRAADAAARPRRRPSSFS